MYKINNPITKRVSSLLIIISLIFSIIRFDLIKAAIVAGPDFNVKISTNNDETYTTSLSNIGSGTRLSFKNVSILDNLALSQTYTINFPTGFTYNSYNLSQNTCGFNLVSATNSNFKYTLSESGALCQSVVIFDYTINASATNGLHNINVLNSVNQIDAQLDLNIVNTNYITRAQTMDLDNDGYIDAYNLSLANSNNIGTLSGLAVAGTSVGPVYSSGSNYILPFTDSIHKTGETPEISGTFDGNNISNNTINEEDLARPKIMKINSTLLSTLGGASLNIGTGNILFELSENLVPSSNTAFSLSNGTNVAGTFSFLGDDLSKLQFAPNSDLQAGTYSLSATSRAKDWSSNGNIINVSIPALIVNDSDLPTGIAIGTNTGISINDGASLTNNQSVQLTLNAIDNVGVSQMMISNDSNFAGASWETYSTSKLNWTLSTGTGIKIVYVKFKDTAGNISATYNDSIEYGDTNNYIIFNNIDSIYTDSPSIELSGSCNYISNTGAILGSTLSGTVNGVSIGTSINCNSQTWSHTFNLTDNTTNIIRLEYDNNSSINNTINIIRPVPTCTTPTNGTLVGGTIYPVCDFTCNTGYTKQGGACIAKSSPVNQAVHNSRTFSFTAFTLYYNNPLAKVSQALAIANGTSTLSTTFTLASDGTSVSLSNSSESISCNSGYHVSGTSCTQDTTTGGGGGGGGGGSTVATCIDTMLQCTLYNNSYIWTKKPGVSCNDGNLGKACIPTTSTGTTNTGTTSTGTTNTGTIGNGSGTSTGTTQIPEMIEIIKIDGTKIYFTDIANHFAKNYIITLASSGMVNGYSDNTFRPNNNTSRIEFLKILLKGLEKDYSSYVGQKNPFWDVVDDSWQSPIVSKALALGIISQNKYFYPDKTISREEAMKMLIRTSGMTMLSVNNSSFADSNGWAKNYIETAYKAGIINGQSISGKLMFRPTDNITRAEVAKLIVKTIEFIKNGNLSTSNTTTDLSTSIKYVKDFYTLTKELKFGDYGDEVGYLQDIMKHYKYFDYDTTKYFGNITKTSYINFAKDKLGITSIDGIVDVNANSKILNLEW